MKESRLINLLRGFSARELEHFGQSLRASAQKEWDDKISLFTELCKYAPGFRHADLDKARFLTRWRPAGEAWSAKQLGHQLSKLTEAAEAFLAWQDFQSDEWEMALRLYRVGQARQQAYLVRKASRRIANWLKHYPFRDQLYYTRRYEWAALQHQYAAGHERAPQPALQQAADELDTFFAFEKTKQLWEMANLEAMLSHRYGYGMGSALQSWLSGQEAYLAAHPVLTIYWLALQLVAKEDQADALDIYQRLRQQLAAQEPVLRPAEAQQLYTGLMNFCARRLNQTNEPRFRRAYFELNQELLQKGWLLDEGQLSPWRYINLTVTALALGEAAWAARFIKHYKDCLPELIRENAYHYVQGHWYYEQGQLDEAQKHLARVAFEEPFFNAGVRLLLAKIFYDAGQEELLFHQLEANRLFLLRDNSMDQHRKAPLQQFNYYLKRLTRLAPHEQQALKDLLAELPSATQLVAYDWLKERILNRIKHES